MGIKCALMAEMERKVAGCDGDIFAVRKFIVEVATKIRIGSFVSSGCAHRFVLFVLVKSMFIVARFRSAGVRFCGMENYRGRKGIFAGVRYSE